MNEITSSENYNRAVLLNRRIAANVRAAQESLFEVCRDLKEIKDGSLYKDLGYDTFEYYCEKELEVSYKQACKYIAVAERYPDGISPGRLGISKLYLISTLSEEEREEIENKLDVESSSKSQLEKAISELKAENKRLEEEKQVTFAELEKLKSKPDDTELARQRIEDLSSQLDKTYKDQLRAEKNEKKIAKELSIANTDKFALTAKVSQLEKKIKELEDREPETITVEDTSEIERLKKELEELRDSKKPEVVTKIVKDDIDEFRAYYAAALDTVARLTSFVRTHNDSDKADFFRDKLKALADTIIDGA